MEINNHRGKILDAMESNAREIDIILLPKVISTVNEE